MPSSELVKSAMKLPRRYRRRKHVDAGGLLKLQRFQYRAILHLAQGGEIDLPISVCDLASISSGDATDCRYIRTNCIYTD